MTTTNNMQKGSVERMHGYAPVNGFKMYYEIHGRGKPLVTIPPAWGCANVFPTLTRNRQLIAVELQGHGHTADIDRPLTFEQMGDDIAALLKYLQIERADFFGESEGGTVALAIAVRHPEIVDRVVTYSSPYSKFEDAYQPDFLGEFVRLSAGDDSVKWQRDNYAKVAPDPERWPTLFSKVHRIAWKGFSRDELKLIKAPVLIASGDHDWLRFEHILEMYRLIPNAQLAVLPDAGHFVLNVDPEKLLSIVAAFLDAPMSKEQFATPKSGYHPGVTR